VAQTDLVQPPVDRAKVIDDLGRRRFLLGDTQRRSI